MANKTLNASVKLDTKSAVSSLTKLEKKIKAVNTAINKTSTGNNKLNTAINKAVTATNKLDSATKKVANTTQKVANTAKKVNNANEKAATSARKMRDNYNASNTAATRLLGTLRSIAGTYFGIMGARAILTASDTITSSENRLNNLPGSSPQVTQQSMDNIYAAAQRSRSGYGDMLSNVSKTMTLAGDAFGDNIDNAIKFQEIMAMSYAIGGASAAEQSSSMYQLVQALGSGVLQGDELRSLREGAPIAYKAIEEFAQGVYNTEDSLKDLASQGLITSELVVAAIMNAETEITESFKNTEMTFAQSWNVIKNMALQAFRPVLQMLNDLLNSDFGAAIVNGIGHAFVWLANTLLWVGDVLGTFFSWCADNWNWIQYVITFALSAIVTWLIYTAGIAIISAVRTAIAWLMVHWQLVLIVIIIAALVTAVIWLANSTVDGCEFIIKALALVGLAIVLIGIITGNVALIVVGIVVMLAALFLMFAQEIIGSAYWCGAVLYNVIMGIANFFIACFNWITAVGYNAFAGIVNFGMALYSAIAAICENVGIAFENCWIWAQNTFWNFIEDVLEGLSEFEDIINGIAEALGVEDFSLSAVIDDVDSKQQEYRSFVDVGAAWDSGMNTMPYKDLSSAWNDGLNTFQYKNLSDAYSEGAQVGENLQNAVGNWGSSIKDKISGLSIGNLANLTDVLGTGIGDQNGSYLPGINDPAYNLDTGYDPSAIGDSLANIDDNVGTIADSMDLSNDDLEYLRRIAEMEWRNEFTTAEIRVDMTNNNTVNSERDLDGIVEYLSDVLREEMTNVAYGTHY